MSEADEGQRFTDLWAWVDEDDDDRSLPAVPAEDVTAIMVVRDAAPWLQEQLDALAALDPKPGKFCAVDVGSEDDSLAMLREASLFDDVYSVARDATFADAVNEVGEHEWLWILHDDSAPDPDALGELLQAAGQADVLYPKLLEQRRRNYPDVIAEAGQSITPTGAVVGTHEAGEIDQHQLEPAAILGGSTAGMLVRGTTWRELGGLAPEVPGGRAGVEFGWRANMAGWRVVTAPDAGLVHREAGRFQERPSDLHPHEVDRLAGLRIVAAHGMSSAKLALATVGRAIGYLLARSPSHAAAELRAYKAFRNTPEATASLTERVQEKHAVRVDEEEVRDLLPPKFWAVRDIADRVGSGFMDRYRSFSETDETLDDLTSDEYAQVGSKRRRVSPTWLLAVLFLLIGVGAGWRLWGLGALSGGGLMPAPASGWDAYLASGAPWLGLAAVVGTVIPPTLLNYLLVLLSPMAAALAFNSMLRAADARPSLAAIGGGLWGAAMLALGLPSAGDVTGMVAAFAGPLFAKAILQTYRQHSSGASRLRAPARAAFWLFVLGAFAPLTLLVVTLAGVVGIVKRVKRQEIAFILGGAWALMLPWLPTLVKHPSRLLTGVDPLAWPLTPPAGVGLLAGRLMPNGVPSWVSIVFFAALGIAAAVASTRISKQRYALGLATWIALGLLGGAGLSRLALPYQGQLVRANLSVPALAVLGAVVLLIVVAEWHRERGQKMPLSVASIGLALAMMLAWPVVGLRGPVGVEAANLPPYVQDTISSPRASRALMITKSDGVLRWNVVEAGRPQWGSGERFVAFYSAFEALVPAFAGEQVPADLAEQLRDLAVSHVWLDGFTQAELRAVGNAAGLTSAPASDTATTYTVTGIVSRAHILENETLTPVAEGVVSKGSKDRKLVVSEEQQVRVSVGGTTLKPVGKSVWDLGAREGELAIVGPRYEWALWWSLIGLTLLALFAAPTLAEERTARRSER